MAPFLALVAAAACNNPKEKEKATREQELGKLKEASMKVLPESFRNIWLGIGEEEFAKARTEARFQPGRSDPDERRWYREVDKTGVNVWYGIDRGTSSLVVIQFANSIPSWKMFSEHATLLMEKYGTDYELYQCPSGDPKFKMTRLLFPRQPVSIMEAVLEAESAIAVTMIVSPLKDARRAIERQKCLRIDKEAAMESWLQENLRQEEKTRPKLPGEPGAGCDKDKPGASCDKDTKK
jgi:hypothetical protein